jgi:hypothetical protein
VHAVAAGGTHPFAKKHAVLARCANQRA